jgi:hypothetical protein
MNTSNHNNRNNEQEQRTTHQQPEQRTISNTKKETQCQGTQQQIKDTANNQNTFNVVLVFYSVCSIFVVTECVLRSEFLVLALMVWCFASGVVNCYCSCSLFHIRARCFSFDFFRPKTTSESMNTSKPDTTTETTSKNKGQRTNSKNNEQYQTPKKKHNVKEQNNNKRHCE